MTQYISVYNDEVVHIVDHSYNNEGFGDSADRNYVTKCHKLIEGCTLGEHPPETVSREQIDEHDIPICIECRNTMDE